MLIIWGIKEYSIEVKSIGTITPLSHPPNADTTYRPRIRRTQVRRSSANTGVDPVFIKLSTFQ